MRVALGASLVVTLLAARLSSAQPVTAMTAPERVVLRTTAGDLVLALYPSLAPQHVGQFLELVRLGAYDTVEIFRVVPGFIVQLAEVDSRRLPLTTEQRSAIGDIPLELSELLHRRGMLSMARREDDSGSARTSFSILVGDSPHLDGKYTIFGHVEAGFDVLEEMTKVARDENDRPRQRIEVLKAEVVPSLEALSRMYIAGAKPIGSAADPLSGGRLRGFFVASVTLMIAMALVSFALSARLTKRVLASISLLICFVGAFALFIYFAPLSEPNHLHGIAVLVGILGVLRLMGKFENPV